MAQIDDNKIRTIVEAAMIGAPKYRDARTARFAKEWMLGTMSVSEKANMLFTEDGYQAANKKLAAHAQQLLKENSVVSDASAGVGTFGTGFDPIMMNVLHRAPAMLLAPKLVGTQQMVAATGQIFYMKARYAVNNPTNTSDTEALYIPATGNVNTGFSGTAPTGSGDVTLTDPFAANYATGSAMTTALGETLTAQEIGFTIERLSVTAGTRSLRAEYTEEMSHDLMRVHNISAAKELENILTQEVALELNREIVQNIFIAAKLGAQKGTTTAGTFDLDLDSDGRMALERFQGLGFQCGREGSFIAKDTRRGRGNFMVVSSDVAIAFERAGMLKMDDFMKNNLDVDEATDTYAGKMGQFDVYIDPYFYSATKDLVMVGYKGSTDWDAGLYYCPYVGIEKYEVRDPNNFQPKMMFKTRYALAGNPYFPIIGSGADPIKSLPTPGQNGYYRKFAVLNLM